MTHCPQCQRPLWHPTGIGHGLGFNVHWIHLCISQHAANDTQKESA